MDCGGEGWGEGENDWPLTPALSPNDVLSCISKLRWEREKTTIASVRRRQVAIKQLAAGAMPARAIHSVTSFRSGRSPPRRTSSPPVSRCTPPHAATAQPRWPAPVHQPHRCHRRPGTAHRGLAVGEPYSRAGLMLPGRNRIGVVAAVAELHRHLFWLRLKQGAHGRHAAAFQQLGSLGADRRSLLNRHLGREIELRGSRYREMRLGNRLSCVVPSEPDRW